MRMTIHVTLYDDVDKTIKKYEKKSGNKFVYLKKHTFFNQVSFFSVLLYFLVFFMSKHINAVVNI